MALLFFFTQAQQGLYCSCSNNLRSPLSVGGTGCEKGTNCGIRSLTDTSGGGWDSRDGHSFVAQLGKGAFLQNFHLPHLFSLYYGCHQRRKEIPAAFPGALVSHPGMFGEEGVRLGCSACQQCSACWRMAAMQPHGPDELVLPYQPRVAPCLPALALVPAALVQASLCVAWSCSALKFSESKFPRRRRTKLWRTVTISSINFSE